jgi:tetratricopeptide (TPR) repeat protein
MCWLIKTKRYEEALAVFTKVVNLDPEGILNDDVYYKVAELYKNQLNLPEKAKEYYQKIIFDYPSSIYLVDARKKFRQLRGDTIN